MGCAMGVLWGAGVVALACASCGGTVNSDASGGQGGRSSGSGGALQAAGGRSATGGQGGSAGRGVGGEPVLIEPDADEACTMDPLGDHWQTGELLLEPYASATIAAGGELALLVYGLRAGGLFWRIAGADGVWSEPTELDATVQVPGMQHGATPRLAVSKNGHTALALWVSSDQVHASVYSEADGFSPAVTLEGMPLDLEGVDALAFNDGRALVGWESKAGITALEYQPESGFHAGATLLTNFAGLSLGEDETPVFYGTSGSITEGSSRYRYTFGSGFSVPEKLPPQGAAGVWQTFLFEFPSGRAARVMRTWTDEATQGLHVSTRQDGLWGAEERVTSFDADNSEVPSVTYAGQDVIVFWKNEERLAFRAHDGKAWNEEASLPRSRSAVIADLAGDSLGSALLVAQQTFDAEGAPLTKLYRRGEDGTWYCPVLRPPVATSQVAGNDAGQYWVLLDDFQRLRTAHFVP